MAPSGHKRSKKTIRGVNLGGWLVLEKWMTPSLFEGLAATDETRLCVELGARAADRLRPHWETFVSESDFVWLAARGLAAVRIPVGYWIFGPPYPYHETFAGRAAPFVEGGLAVLDQAFAWAERHGLGILLDLHAAPGCQNGFDNGGLLGVVDWHRKEEYIRFTLEVLERLAERYQGRTALHGIEVLNEPHWDIPTALLKDFTRQACRRIRRHCRAREAAVVFHDGFRSHREYIGFLAPPGYANVVLDIHRYQCFDPHDLARDLHGHLRKAAVQRKREADRIRAELSLRTYVGEWSLGLDRNVVSLWAPGPMRHPLEGLDAFQRDVACRAYGAAQLASFESYDGWFFWSYKTETTPAWSFRESVTRGWLPGDYR